MGATAPYAARIFDPARWRADQPLKVVMIGTDFQVRVWEALLEDPDGAGAKLFARSPPASARPRHPGRSAPPSGPIPLSFVVPCHRAVGKSGALTGYHWGLTRKRAILGWEAGQLAAG